MTYWVLEEAIGQCAAWRQAGIEVGIAVNLSLGALHDPALEATLTRLLTGARLPAACLHLELTESMLMADGVRSLTTLARLRERGIRLSLDDFGTGYSSLARLKHLPIDTLKIDRSFVHEMASAGPDAMIVRTTVELGHALGLSITAEGVEDGETCDLLRRLRCDSVQGYHLSRPQPAAALSDWLRTHPGVRAGRPIGAS